MSSVLLLNASYEPLKIISWQRAVSLFFLGKVEVIEEYQHDIRSVSLVIKAPAVVRLLNYVRLGRRSPVLSRANLLARDNFKCQYCGISLTASSATLDHVVPRSKGGKKSWENMVCACVSCNVKKGNKSLKQSRMKLIKEPLKPEWLPILQIRLDGKVPECWQDFLSSIAQSS